MQERSVRVMFSLVVFAKNLQRIDQILVILDLVCGLQRKIKIKKCQHYRLQLGKRNNTREKCYNFM